MKAGTAIFWGLAVCGALIMFGLFGRGCMGCAGCSNLLPVVTLPTAPTSTGSAPLPLPIAPPSPSYAPSPGPVFTPSDASNLPQCASTMVGKGSGRWYLVSTTLDSGYTLAARLCTSGGFKAADSARIVARTAYLTEGGHEASGTIDTSRKLSDMAPGKAYVDVLKPGSSSATVRFENPYVVFIDEGNAFDFCSQYKDITSESVKDDLVKSEIVARCRIAAWGGPQAAHHMAVAQGIQAWYSRKNGADLEGTVKGLKDKIAELERRTDKTPVDLDFDPNGPTTKK